MTSYGDEAFSLFLRKAFIKAAGYSDDALDRPIVGIANTSSDYNPCHGNAPQLIEAVKRGVMLSGALPMVFPTISIHESFAHPTSMVLRNLMAMDTEEMVRAQPMDAVVVVGGCDKTLPAQIMGAVSADLPTVVVPVGPMVVGHHKGETLGACTDCRRLWSAYRAGDIDDAEIEQVNDRLAPSVGTCMVMGTASTMAIIAETLGLTVPFAASIPAPHAERVRSAEASGRVAAAMAISGAPLPSAHRHAGIAAQRHGRAAGDRRLDQRHHPPRRNRRPRRPCDRPRRVRPDRPRGAGAGRFEAVGRALHGAFPQCRRRAAAARRAHAIPRPVGANDRGGTLGDRVMQAADMHAQDVIRPLDRPIKAQGAMAVLYGNLCPRGAVIKHSAASPALLQHSGRAVVFDSVEDLARRIDDPALDVEADDVLVLRNAGPRGAPGMPEAGYIPIPKKLAARGVKDMVRLSDARMSGTAFGTIVLHISPEAAIGGPLALVRNGDQIRLDVAARRIDMLVDEAELAQRAAVAPYAGRAAGARLCAALSRPCAAGRCRLRFRFPDRPAGKQFAFQRSTGMTP